MDLDSPWEENPNTDHILEAEWAKITSEFTNSGYREGIIAGKEASLQQGFDTGFADVGVPLGRELGNLRGAAAALRSFLSSKCPESLELEEIRSISTLLSTIRFSDIAPQDLEAEQHTMEHVSFDDPGIIVENTNSSVQMTSKQRRTVEDIAKLKERLASLGMKLGLPMFVGETGRVSVR